MEKKFFKKKKYLRKSRILRFTQLQCTGKRTGKISVLTFTQLQPHGKIFLKKKNVSEKISSTHDHTTSMYQKTYKKKYPYQEKTARKSVLGRNLVLTVHSCDRLDVNKISGSTIPPRPRLDNLLIKKSKIKQKLIYIYIYTY